MDLYKMNLVVLGWIVAVLLLSPPVLAQNVTEATDLEAFLDGIFAIQMEQYHVPGIGVAVINQGGILLAKGYGFADLAKSSPLDPKTTLHRTGSNSKILVWIAVLQLVEEGKLDLYTDINEYLDFSIPNKTADGKVVLPITLHHLLTHTAGFEDVVSQLIVTQAESVQPLKEFLQTNPPARVFAPGSIVAYSNYGTTLAAYIVELVTEQVFTEYCQEHILDPLKMSLSTFDQPLSKELTPLIAQGYSYQGGKHTASNFEYIQAYPAGALSSTVTEMANLIRLLINQGTFEEQMLLTTETAKLMQTHQFRSHPDLPGVTYGLLEADYNGYQVLSHGGDTLFFHTGLYFLPTEQIGLYVVYNSADSSFARTALFHAFMDRYFPAKEQALTPSPLPQEAKDSYKGVFYHARSNSTKLESWLRLVQSVSLTIDQEGYLVLTDNGQQSRYGTISPNLFQEIEGKNLLAVSLKNNQVQQIHFPGPVTLLRASWYQTPGFIGGLLVGALFFMLLTIVGWTKQLFNTKNNTATLLIPKLCGLLTILLCFTIMIFFVDAVLDFYPGLSVPLVLFQTPSTLKTILLLTKVLVALGIIQLLLTLYLWVAGNVSVWQRVYFTLLTASVGSVIWVFWQVNFF